MEMKMFLFCEIYFLPMVNEPNLGPVVLVKSG